MTNIVLYKFVLAALLAIWPGRATVDAAPAGLANAADVVVMAYCMVGMPAQERRVCRIAREVATVVDEHAVKGHIPFQGPAGDKATALALLEIAWHESDFREKVEDCRITGDLPDKHSKITEGLAVSMYQLQSNSRYDLFLKHGTFAGTNRPRPKYYARDAVCNSNPLATRLALHALMRKAWVVNGTPHPSSIRSMFFAYSGNGGRKSKAGMQHVEKFEAMMRQNGLELVPKNGAMWVREKP